MDIFYIEWLDSSALEGWQSIEEASELKPLMIKTVGFLLAETEESYTLTQSQNGPDGLVDYSLCIPKFAVKLARKLSV